MTGHTLPTAHTLTSHRYHPRGESTTAPTSKASLLRACCPARRLSWRSAQTARQLLLVAHGTAAIALAKGRW